MSGHSKWATIKRQKGANDAKRGQAFTKLSAAITLAVKEGGGIPDPEKNFRLRLAIEAARAQNMPKDTIERAIERASGKSLDQMEEVIYEGFGPGGISIIIKAITDNKQRTTPEIRSLFEKNGGVIGNPGAVSYQFQQVGEIIINSPERSVDEIMLVAADAGAQDIIEDGGEISIFTRPEDLNNVRENLIKQGLHITEASIVHKPIIFKEFSTKEDEENALNFLEKIEDHQDVQNVFSNASFTPEINQGLQL